MSNRLLLGVLCSALFGLSGVAAQDQQEKKKPGADPNAELQAYLEASKPGPEHKKLRMRVGNWQVAGTFYMAPGAPPMKSEARSNIRPIMGGRYFRESYTGEFFGMKFTGIGVYGYDKGLKKYVSTWIDSMSTGVMRSEGTADDSGNVITSVGEYFDPMRKQTVKTKYVLTLTSRQTHTAAMFEIDANGAERKVMELVYMRAGKGGKGGKGAKAGKGAKKKDGAKKGGKKNKKKDKDA